MQPIPQPMPRLSFEGFSLLAPQGDHWCILDLNTRTGVVFATTPLMGQNLTKPPTDEELDDLLVAVASQVEIEGDPIGGTQVRDFVNGWLRMGQPSHVNAGKRILSRSSNDAGRFKLVDSNVVIDDGIGSSCVRFDATVEEHGNPRWPGEVLVSVERGNLLCRSPRTRGAFVWIGASERYKQSRPPHPLLTDTRAQEIEAFTRSLSFAQSP